MIQFNQIHIEFQDTIIQEGTITIYPGEITLLTGKSGSGKTSLLNLLALLDQHSSFEFLYNNQNIDLETFRQNEISYVFQDYNLIEDLSVDENFATMFNLSKKKYSIQAIEELLDLVDISPTKLKVKSRSLSGGQKQRLAIALALVKEPSLLLLDEPTASLDSENTQRLISLLEKLAKKDLMIVIATHSPELFHSKHIYHIENKQIIEIKSEEHQINSIQANRIKDYKYFNYFKYCFTHITNHAIYTTILLLFTIIAISYILFVGSIQNYANQYFNNILSTFEHTTIVVNNTAGDFENKNYYCSSAQKFTKEQINQISALPHIKNVEPYYSLYFTTDNIIDYNGQTIDYLDYSNNIEKKTSTITYQNSIYDTSQQSNQRILFATYNEEKLENYCILKDSNCMQGIYISSNLASQLGINSLDHTKITIPMPIIVGIVKTEALNLIEDIDYITNEDGILVSKEDGIPPSSVYSYDYYYAIEDMEVEVKGVYESINNGYNAFYDSYYGEKIYLSSSWVDKMHNDILNNAQIMERLESCYLQIEGQKELSTDLVSSTLIIEADSNKNTDHIITQIEGLFEYTSFNTSKSQMKILKEGSIYYESVIRMIIAIILISIAYCMVQYYTITKRKKEFALLKADGLKHVSWIPCFEWFMIGMISFPFSIILTNSLLKLYYRDLLSYNYSTLILHIIIIIYILFLITLINILLIKRINTIKELRGK